MKKKIVLFIIMFSVIFLTSGCGGGHPSTKNEIEKYLKANYPNETFTVSYNGKIFIESGGCEDVYGNSWRVTSNETGLTFTVQDDYHLISFTCYYFKKDDYLKVYISHKINYIGDNRIKVDDYFDSINLNMNDFKSLDELANCAVYIRNVLLSDERIENDLLDSFDYHIYDNDELIRSISIRESNNKEYILEKIQEGLK